MAHLPTVLRHVWAFKVAADEGKFQLAADRLGIAESAVSRRIRLLEEELGFALFDRRSKGAVLTPEGEVFHERINALLSGVEEAVGKARRTSVGNAGVLKLGFIELAIRTAPFAQAIQSYRSRFPDVELDLLPVISSEAEHALREGKVDICFFQRNREPLADFEYREVATFHLMLALPRQHRLAAKPKVRLADLADEILIFPRQSQSPRLHERLMTTLRISGIRPNILTEVGSSEAVLGMVASGLGIGFVDSSRRDGEPDTVVLRPIADFDATILIEMAWRRNDRSKLVPNFVTLAAAPQPSPDTGRLRPVRAVGA